MEAKQFKRILEMRLNANFEQDQFSTRLKYDRNDLRVKRYSSKDTV